MLSTAPIKTAALGMAAMLLGISAPVMAQSTATCGITGSANATAAVYDPFNPAGLATTNVTLTLTRMDPPGANGGKTAVVSLFLRSTTPSADGTSIIPTSVIGAVNHAYLANTSIFYDYAATAPFMGPPTANTLPSGTNRYLKVEFTGNNEQSNPVTVNFSITLPANLNVSSGTVLPFDAEYRCTTNGGGNPTDQAGSLPGTIRFPITVLSALQASFVGTALDFGEIGDISNSAASTRNTGLSNYVRVQSSGAYTISYASQNGFRLLHPAGVLGGGTSDEIAYSLAFLGQSRSGSDVPQPGAVALTRQCARAGIGSSEEDRLPMIATLVEGGQGKDPSLGGTYRDTLTVTVTPAAIGTIYATDCTAF